VAGYDIGNAEPSGTHFINTLVKLCGLWFQQKY